MLCHVEQRSFDDWLAEMNEVLNSIAVQSALARRQRTMSEHLEIGLDWNKLISQLRDEDADGP
jgi:hypothetical protein